MSDAGDSKPLEYYKSLTKWSQKRDFGMAMSLNREDALAKARETVSASTIVSSEDKRGWLAIWEIADIEKIPYQPDHPVYAQLLEKAIEGVPARPHSKPQWAELGHLEYDYFKKSNMVIRQTRKETFGHNMNHS